MRVAFFLLSLPFKVAPFLIAWPRFQPTMKFYERLLLTFDKFNIVAKPLLFSSVCVMFKCRVSDEPRVFSTPAPHIAPAFMFHSFYFFMSRFKCPRTNFRPVVFICCSHPLHPPRIPAHHRLWDQNTNEIGVSRIFYSQLMQRNFFPVWFCKLRSERLS